MTHQVNWRPVTEAPEDRQICHIRGDGKYLLMSIMYVAEMGAWVDLFATREAGASYNRTDSGITAWVPEDELDLNGGMPDAEESNQT